MNVKIWLKRYFINTSILAHCALIIVIVVVVSEKITHHWRWPLIKRWVLGDVDKTEVYPLGVAGYAGLPEGQWIKIHQQKPDDLVYFVRQKHAGSGFDIRRSRLFVFGSDTHGSNWDNAVYTFDMNALQWSRSYVPDLPISYAVNSYGFPVAGVNKNHPWAMHTYAAVAYHQLNEKLIVASYPRHLSPERYGQNLSSVWMRIKKHPTWIFDPRLNRWQAVGKNNQLFFPYAIAYDSDRGVVTGFKPNGIYDWKGNDSGWVKIAERAVSQYHTNAVYDSVNHVFLLFGGNKASNAVYVYKVGEKISEKMPTLGIRPPGGQSVPLAFHTKTGKMVALVNTETWVYDYAADQWQEIESAKFPYPVGMNYTMEYDARHNVVVLISSPDKEPTAVWVLRL